MQISNEFPPNWKEIVEHFGENKETVITYGDTLYNPFNRPITRHLEAHEEVHSLQQASYPGGVENWWANYFVLPAFRLEQEAEAYGRQMMVGGIGKDRKMRRNALQTFARALSGPIYGNCCSFEQAQEKIKQHMI